MRNKMCNLLIKIKIWMLASQPHRDFLPHWHWMSLNSCGWRLTLALEMFIYEHGLVFFFAWNGNSESWDWHRKDYCLQKDPDSGKFSFWFFVNSLVCVLKWSAWCLLGSFFLADISECLWNGVPQNKEDLSYMFDETTPVKACGDLAYHVAHSGIFFFPFHHRLFPIFFDIIVITNAFSG